MSCFLCVVFKVHVPSCPSIFMAFQNGVEIKGFEPLTPCLQGRCSPNWAIPPQKAYYLYHAFSFLSSTFLFFNSGSHLLSHIVSNIVPSAAQVLTIVFGMETGVSPARIATRIFCKLYLPLGLSGLEPPTSRLSGVRSNRLSYKPVSDLFHSVFSLIAEQYIQPLLLPLP